MNVICDSDESQWIMVIDNQARYAQLLPVVSGPDSDKKLVLWDQKKLIILDRKNLNYQQTDTISYREFTELVQEPLPL